MNGRRRRGHGLDFLIDIIIIPSVGKICHFQAGAGLGFAVFIFFYPVDILPPIACGTDASARRDDVLHGRLPEDEIGKVRIVVDLQVFDGRETRDLLLEGAAGCDLEALHVRLKAGLGRDFGCRFPLLRIVHIDGFRSCKLDLGQVLLLQALGQDIPGVEFPVVLSLFVGIERGQGGFRPVPAGLFSHQAEGRETAQVAVGPFRPDRASRQGLNGLIKIHGLLAGHKVAEVPGHIEAVGPVRIGIRVYA